MYVYVCFACVCMFVCVCVCVVLCACDFVYFCMHCVRVFHACVCEIYLLSLFVSLYSSSDNHTDKQ